MAPCRQQFGLSGSPNSVAFQYTGISQLQEQSLLPLASWAAWLAEEGREWQGCCVRGDRLHPPCPVLLGNLITNLRIWQTDSKPNLLLLCLFKSYLYPSQKKIQLTSFWNENKQHLSQPNNAILNIQFETIMKLEVKVTFTSLSQAFIHTYNSLAKNGVDQDDLRSCQWKISLQKLKMKFEDNEFHIRF